MMKANQKALTSADVEEALAKIAAEQEAWLASVAKYRAQEPNLRLATCRAIGEYLENQKCSRH